MTPLYRNFETQAQLFSVRPCRTPIWVNWGSEESTEFARQAASFDAAWRLAGNKGELSALPGADHFIGLHGFEHADSSLCQWLLDKLRD